MAALSSDPARPTAVPARDGSPTLVATPPVGVALRDAANGQAAQGLSSRPTLADRIAAVRAAPLAGRAALILGTIAAVVWLVGVLWFRRGTAGWGFDFQAYMLAAERLDHGGSPYLPSTLAGPFRPGPFGLYLYAPPLATSVLPLTRLSGAAAADLWVFGRVIVLLVACALMPVATRIRVAVLLVAVVSEPMLTDLTLGNVSLLVMLCAVLAWRWLDRPAGSVALAVAMTLRPTLGLFLGWWFVRRRWRALAWALGAGVVLVALTLPIAGPAAYGDYLRVLANIADVTGVDNNADLGTIALQFGLGGSVAGIALALGFAVAGIAVVASLRRDREVGFMVVLGATLLLSPLLWDHYLVDLLLPAAFLAARGRPWALGLPLLAWLGPPVMPLLALAATLLPFAAGPVLRATTAPPVRPATPARPRSPAAQPRSGGSLLPELRP